MGFGLLFIGYSMLILGTGVTIDAEIGLAFDFLPDLLGYLLIFRGLSKLKPYSKGFVFARYLTFPLIILSGVILALQGGALLGNILPAVKDHYALIANINLWLDIVSIPVLVFFHFYLCQGIGDLAAEVELPKVVRRSKISTILSCTYFLGRLLTGIVGLPNIIQLCIAILLYVLYFYNLSLLYSCYMRIAYADEEPRPIFNPLMKLLEKSKKNKSGQDQD